MNEEAELFYNIVYMQMITSKILNQDHLVV